jgi:ribokinase
MDVIGFGALNVDLFYEVKSLKPFGIKAGSEEASKPTLDKVLMLLEKTGTLKDKSGGGSAANTVYALSEMGFDTGYIGKVGEGKNGGFLIDSLGSIDKSKILKSGESGLCIALLDETRDRANLIFPNANDTLNYDEIDIDYAKSAKFLHMTSFVGEIPFEAQIKLAAELDQSTLVSFDPGEIYAKKGLEKLLPILKNCFIIFPTEREIKLMTGKEYKEGAEELLKYVSIVACKRGENGTYTLTRDVEYELSFEKIKPVDKTGAGDVYAAAFLAGILHEKPLNNCAIFAQKAAAQSIIGYGREKYPDKRFLEENLI